MPSNLQGGKSFGLLKEQQRVKLDEINKEYLEDQKYRDEEDLAEKLEGLKNKYAEFDLNDQGEIDMMGLKRTMEKMGVPKTHLELKKMIVEVTGGSSNTINYRDFVKMMLGKRSAVLKLVLIFEDKANGSACKPDGPPQSGTFPACLNLYQSAGGAEGPSVSSRSLNMWSVVLCGTRDGEVVIHGVCRVLYLEE